MPFNLQFAIEGNEVTVVADDTDVLVLLMYHWKENMANIHFQSKPHWYPSMYGGKKSDSLNSLRYAKFMEMVTSSKSPRSFHPEKKQHIFIVCGSTHRSYFGES